MRNGCVRSAHGFEIGAPRPDFVIARPQRGRGNLVQAPSYYTVGADAHIGPRAGTIVLVIPTRQEPRCARLLAGRPLRRVCEERSDAPQGGLISGLRAALRRLASETRLRAQSCPFGAIHLLAISRQA